MRKVYAFVLLAVVAMGIAVYPRSESRAAPEASGEQRAELARLRSELEEERALRTREIARIDAQLRSLAPAAPAPEAQAAGMPTMTVIEKPEAEPREHAEPVDPSEKLESFFADQATDASWANATEAHVTQKIRDSLPGARVQSIECHATLCRLETVHASAAAYGQFLNESKQLWRGEAFSQEPIEGAAGELVVVSYLAREGEPLALAP